MPTVSILTAAYAPTATYLLETIDSVKDQALPEGWTLEWVVQEDGSSPALADKFDGLNFVKYRANGAQLGLAMTRNLALSRVSGELVQVLDHDDILLPGVFTTLIPHFADGRIHWAIGQADDLMPDGQRLKYESEIPFGMLPAGMVNTWAAEHGGNWPIHCASLLMRTTSVRALGGWIASPSDDDLAMFAALSELTDGHYDESLTWLYRHHPQQTHRSDSWKAWSTEGRRIALQRRAAMRQFRGIFLGGHGDVASDVPTEVGPLTPKRSYPGTAAQG